MIAVNNFDNNNKLISLSGRFDLEKYLISTYLTVCVAFYWLEI